MNRKIYIIVLIVVILFGIIVIWNITNQNSKNNVNAEETQVLYNEETGMYYIQDEEGEVLHQAEDESSLYIYTIDPDYDPKIYDFEDDVILVDETFEE